MKVAATSLNCDCDGLRMSRTFAGLADFDIFAAAIKEVALFAVTPVLIPYSNVGLLERWYKCRKCDQVWRLVEPDPPFAGIWERIA
jgi:hypothetical protein